MVEIIINGMRCTMTAEEFNEFALLQQKGKNTLLNSSQPTQTNSESKDLYKNKEFSETPVISVNKHQTIKKLHNCPECSAKIYYRRSEEIWRCRSCPWEGKIENSTPLTKFQGPWRFEEDLVLHEYVDKVLKGEYSKRKMYQILYKKIPYRSSASINQRMSTIGLSKKMIQHYRTSKKTKRPRVLKSNGKKWTRQDEKILRAIADRCYNIPTTVELVQHELPGRSAAAITSRMYYLGLINAYHLTGPKSTVAQNEEKKGELNV